MEIETSGVIAKTLNVLESFLKEQDCEIGISRLAELNGLKVSTAHRIASILVDKGYLKQPEKRGKYTLGLKFLQFNDVIKRNLKIQDIALPFLERLRLVSGESVNLAILDRNEVVYIEHIDSNQTLRTFTAIGNRAPLYCTGVGKVFLANMNKEGLQLLSHQPFTRYTDNTITDFTELTRELSFIQREGVAIDNGEMDSGVRCIAAPIKNSEGKVAASISTSGPYTRLNATRVEELKPLIRNAGLEISRAMGYIGD